MRNHYRPLRSGKRSLAVALIVPLVLAAGVYVALDRPSIVIPAVVMAPDTAQRSTKSEPFYEPSPMPRTATPAALPSKPLVQRALGPGVFKCQEENGAISYSEYPCGDGKLIDTKPTSGGFNENWSISVKGR